MMTIYHDFLKKRKSWTRFSERLENEEMKNIVFGLFVQSIVNPIDFSTKNKR